MSETLRLQNVARDADSVVTVGTFDGVHIGHQAILRYLIERAEAQDGSSVVVTFDPHPREVVHGEEVPLLTTPAERSRFIQDLGIDRIVVVPFTTEFSRLSSDEFVRKVLVEQIGLKEIVVGYDHGFGRGRSGNRETLEQLGSELDFTVDVIPAQHVHDTVVSSTEIRKTLVGAGDVVKAAELLGRRYNVGGSVVRGDARGRLIGFPTANIQLNHPRKVLPASGVYAVTVTVDTAGVVGLPGMLNIGIRPTVSEGRRLSVEVHMLGFEGDVYGHNIDVQFVTRLRDEQKFSSLEELQDQLTRDREHCLEVFRTVF